MRKRLSQQQPKLRRYKYTLQNKSTGLGIREPFSRIIYCENDKEAKERVAHICYCFGASTKVTRLVKLVPKGS